MNNFDFATTERNNVLTHNFNTETIYKSKDYKLFNFLDFNRVISKPHVNLLMSEMKQHGFVGVMQVIYVKDNDGVSRYYIVDGQHRFTAAVTLGIEIKFQITELGSRRDVANLTASLNTSAKAWGTANFLSVWSSMGIKEYVKLDAIRQYSGFQITPLLEAYLENSNQMDYRKGIMKFPNESNSDMIIEQMVELNDYLPKKAFCRRTIVKVMRNPKYNHDKMRSAIINYSTLMGGFTENEKELRLELDRLLNQNCK